MVRLGNQVRYVLLTYATRPVNWFWFGFVVLWVGWHLLIGAGPSGESGNDEGMAGRLPWITLLLTCALLANVVHMQTPHQFMHYRAKLMPSFALAHLLVPFGIAVLAGFAVPAIFTYAHGFPLLPMAAVSSALIAAMLLSSLASLLVLLAIIVPVVFGFSLWDVHVTLSEPIDLAVLVGAWLAIVYFLVRLTSIGEEDPAYERLLIKSGDVRARPATSIDWYAQPPRSAVWRSSSVRWRIADYWHDRIGGYHEGKATRISRLLRHGGGAVPPELQALGAPMILLAISLLLTWDQDTEDVIDPLATMHLVPMLGALFFPGALAVEPLPQRRPFLRSEIMLPLSRETLIDRLLAIAKWKLGLLWLTMNGVVLYFLWTVPGLEPSFLRAGTYLFLSAAITIAFFGVSLTTVLWESLISRILAALFSVGVGVTLMLMWWFMRDGTTDVPFWIAGLIVLAFGRAMIKDARRAWLDLELG